MNSVPARLSTVFGDHSPATSSDLGNGRISSSSSNRIEQIRHGFSSGSSHLDGIFSSPARLESLTSTNSRLSTPGSNTKNYLNNSLCNAIGRSPALERLLKKISKKNGKGETPLHTAAIRG